MSIIVKPNCTGSIGGGSNKGFPPDGVILIDHIWDNEKVLVKWQDPDDTIVGDIPLSQWMGTILVRNDNHYPESIKDGIVVLDNKDRNKYKDIYFEDTGLNNDTTYYYRFFTYSIEGIYSMEFNEFTIFNETPKNYEPIFSNNRWDIVDRIVNSGSIPSTWNIGDEIDITLSGDFNEIITLQIWDFNHFDKFDGSGKAGLVLGCKYFMENTQQMHQYNDGNGWNFCTMRTNIMPKIYNSLPSDLKPYIKEVNTISNTDGTNVSGSLYTSQDRIFIPNSGELNLLFQTEMGPAFPIFTDFDSRRRASRETPTTYNYWWTRTARNTTYYSITGTGSAALNYNPVASLHICFCFCI